MSTVFPNITKCESRVDGLWAAAVGAINNAVGRDPIERLRFLAPGTGAREGGEKRNLSIGSIPVCLYKH